MTKGSCKIATFVLETKKKDMEDLDKVTKLKETVRRLLNPLLGELGKVRKYDSGGAIVRGEPRIYVNKTTYTLGEISVIKEEVSGKVSLYRTITVLVKGYQYINIGSENPQYLKLEGVFEDLEHKYSEQLEEIPESTPEDIMERYLTHLK